MVNPIPAPVWASSDKLEELHLTWQPNEELGIMVIQESKEDVPVVVFCSLFERPESVFYDGLDKRSAGLTFSEVRGVLNRLEQMFEERPLR